MKDVRVVTIPVSPSELPNMGNQNMLEVPEIPVDRNLQREQGKETKRVDLFSRALKK